MSGRRILDAVALFNASRNVAAKHFSIRFSQLELYGKTSSLAKAARRQNPVLSTTVQNFTQAAANAARSQNQSTQIPAGGNVPSATSPVPSEEGVKQDHFYDRSEQHSSVEPAPDESLTVEQAKATREPLPDGTIPPAGTPVDDGVGVPDTFNTRPTTETSQKPLDSQPQADLSVQSSGRSSIPEPSVQNPLSSEDAKRLQRQSESQIPVRSAGPPDSEASSPPFGAQSSEARDFGIEQEQDVYYQPPGTSSPVLSALPRVKVPKSESDVQEGAPGLSKNINADVFYAGSEKGEADEAKQELAEEQISQLFHSPRVARMMSGKKGGYVPGGVRSKGFHTRAGQLKDDVRETEDIKQLAADMAKDAQKPNVSIFVHADTWS